MAESSESLEDGAPAESTQAAPRAPVAMAAARHKFLMIGMVLAIVIGIALILVNQAAKEENKFQSMAYQTVPKNPKPAKIGLPAPTNLVRPAE